MKVKYLGEVVREQRKLLGVSLEQLCTGLCTSMTLSRFERGRQTPSRDCVAAILQRLGLPDDRYYAQLTREETQLIRLRKDVLTCCSQFERTCGEERRQARINGMEKLHELECRTKADDRINRQFILGTKVSLESYPPQKQLEILMEAIRLTSPRFDVNELSSCLYSTAEVSIISKIALRYALCGQGRVAVDIYGQLLRLIRKRTPNHVYLYLVAYNYALCLASEKRWEEAREVSELGRQACIRQGYYGVLPRFLHMKAECCYLMGEISQSMELYRSAYYIYGAAKDTVNQESLKADVWERFQLTL